ncbi:MAG: flagellar basal body-associated FliL family protein [Treponemataceae bacterium]
MADEENIDLGEASDLGDSGKKKGGGLGGLLPMLIKWIVIIIGAIILIVTVVVVTMGIMNNNRPQQAATPTSQEYVGKREILDWYTSLSPVRTRTSDALPSSVVIEVVLGYKSQDKIASTEITQRQIEIGDFLRRYFTEKTTAELRPQNEDKLRIEIRNAINDDILSSSKIRDVRFRNFDVVQQ